MKRPLMLMLAVAIVAATMSAGMARSVQDDKKSEPELLIKTSKFLEERPFDKDAKKARGWAITWIIETDKVSVMVCSLILGVEEIYKYSSELISQYTIGMAAFKLANPERAKDEDAAQLAGIESSIKAYEAIVKDKPKHRNAFMDDLITKRTNGTLAAYVLENNCKDKK